MCKISAYVAFDKATNGQTDIKHEREETLSWMSLLKIAVEKLPPSQRSTFPNSIFAREDAFQLRSSTVTFSWVNIQTRSCAYKRDDKGFGCFSWKMVADGTDSVLQMMLVCSPSFFSLKIRAWSKHPVNLCLFVLYTFPNSIFARVWAFHIRSSKVTLSYVFFTFRVVYLFVRSSLCRRQHLPKIRTLFYLVHIKKLFIFNVLCVLICSNTVVTRSAWDPFRERGSHLSFQHAHSPIIYSPARPSVSVIKISIDWTTQISPLMKPVTGIVMLKPGGTNVFGSRHVFSRMRYVMTETIMVMNTEQLRRARSFPSRISCNRMLRWRNPRFSFVELTLSKEVGTKHLLLFFFKCF